MKFYRLESSGGIGIYNPSIFRPHSKANEVQQELFKYHNCTNDSRPNLNHDFYHKRFDRDFFFACDSLETLRHWFDNGLFEKLISLRNVKVLEYESEKFVIGKSKLQYVFVKEKEPTVIPKGKIKRILAI